MVAFAMSHWRANNAASSTGPDDRARRKRGAGALRRRDSSGTGRQTGCVGSRVRGVLRCASPLVYGALHDLCHLPLDSRRDTAAPRGALVVA